MAQAAKKKQDQEPAATEMDTAEAVDKFAGAMQVFAQKAEEDRRAKMAAAMDGPVVQPGEVLVRDPETHERLVFYAVTPTQYLKIGFKLMRRAELKRVPESKRADRCVTWPERVKALIVRACLVEPVIDFPERDVELVKWVEENMAWPTLDDLLLCIYNESQPSMRVPDIRAIGAAGEAGDSRQE